MKAHHIDKIEADITASIANAFRRRAIALRAKAAAGCAVTEGNPPIVIISSESRKLLDFASDWDAIAADIEGAIT
jgi:hypothetical protein